jgi:RNA polymerase sigma-70 factor, ECF subfamily
MTLSLARYHAEPRSDVEVDLVRRAQQGDADAFDQLVAARMRSSFRLARAIVGDTSDAEDVTQDAFVAVWRSLPRLRDLDRFDAWFGRILVNAARMSVRRRGPALARPIAFREADSDEEGLAGLVAGRIDSALNGVVASDALQRAIDRLSVDQRTILALHHLEGRPVTEVAAAFGIPVGTAKWRLHAARAALERAMEHER